MSGEQPFATQDLWRPSIFLDENLENGGSLPSQFDLQPLPQLAKDNGATNNFFDTSFESLTLEADQLDGGDIFVEQNNAVLAPTTEAFRSNDLESDAHDDVWSIDLETDLQSKSPRFLTWERFENVKLDQLQAPRYLSEAGPAVYDAVLQRRSPSAGVLPQDTIFRAMCNLSLGRSSLFFRWDPRKTIFCPTLEDVPISGFSLDCSQSLIQYFIETGSRLRRLNDYGVDITTKDQRSCMWTMKYCITQVVSVIETTINTRSRGLNTLAQLQHLMQTPADILSFLNDMLIKVADARSDDEVVSVIADQVYLLQQSGSIYVDAAEALLALVSTPWLMQVAAVIGVVNASGAEYRHFFDVLDLGQTAALGDSYNGSVATSSQTASSSLNPSDRSTIRSIRVGLDVLSQHLPDHPLVAHGSFEIDLMTLNHDPNTAEEIARTYAHRMATSVASYDTGNMSQHDPGASSIIETPADDTWLLMDALGPLDAANETGFTEREAALTKTLQNSVTKLLEQDALDGIPDIPEKAKQYLGSSPLEPMRPLINVQARLVHSAVLRFLFERSQLRRHLELHRAFHLFGNGAFLTRMCTALFSNDVQSAARKRGFTPTSQTMGLGLDKRKGQNWPPASSELQLTLMGILNDSVQHERDSKEIGPLGSLSFAIRELSEEEIAKVMDPNSIHAMDFLKLQYVPPAALQELITPSIANKYDSIFRTLLMQVRMLHVVDQMSKATLQRNPRSSRDEIYRSNYQQALQRFVARSHHVVTVLASYTDETAIEASWRPFHTSICGIETDILKNTTSSETLVVGIGDIIQMHESCLDQIRGRMFLRRKHEGIRQSIEAIYDLVLQQTMILQDQTVSSQMTNASQQLDRSIIRLLTLLNKAADKGLNSARAAHDQDETEAIHLLRERLDWNKFYERRKDTSLLPT